VARRWGLLALILAGESISLYMWKSEVHVIIPFCRCGGIFCAVHRYAEAHSCTFDYKAEGRQMIARTNPVVAAQKLPKI
jgi:hypothetical protein